MQKIEKTYTDHLPAFEGFTKRLAQLIENLLVNSGVKFHLVESRTKSLKSFCEKISRKQGKYIKPLTELTDICGLRVIVFYIDDLEKVEKILADNFRIDPEHSYNAKNKLSEKEFGYLSSHFVVSLNDARRSLLEWRDYSEFRAEVQVRTVLQHAWAAISHELEYKKSYDIPSVLKRKLFRLASLVELADEEFQEAKKKHLLVETAIYDRASIDKIEVFEEINIDTLSNYFQKPDADLKLIVTNAKKAGFTIKNNIRDIPEAGVVNYQSDIIRLCSIKNIFTMSHYRANIKELSMVSYIGLSSLYKIDNVKWVATPEFLIVLLLILSLDKNQLEKYDSGSWDKSSWLGIKKCSLALKRNVN